ncbi:MAG: hypothetical protein ACRD0K_04835 [Egibacteraceae bacterium]
MNALQRLTPVNAVLALLTPHDIWPARLADLGFRKEGLEVPVRSSSTTTVLDVLAGQAATNLLLGFECKSGANVAEPQAQRLKIMSAKDVVRTGAVTLRSPSDVKLEIAYVCLAQYAERVTLGMKRCQWNPPVLAVGEKRDRLWLACFRTPTYRVPS